MAPQCRRRIVVCMDGTWNDRDSKTNIYRWFRHIDDESRLTFDGNEWVQKPAYFNGSGFTSNGIRDKFGGATGEGVDQQILCAYDFIGNHIRDYENDQIWVIGFSRGAFAARSLVGMLHNVGLMSPDKLTRNNLNVAYDLYRDRSPDTSRESKKANQLRQDLNSKNPHIEFVGCFDTVGTLGIPTLPFYLGGSFGNKLFYSRYRFHDLKMSHLVKSAFHAISIHEQREAFEPVLMEDANGNSNSEQLTQMWFPGVHEDIGGGVDANGHDDNILANKSLRWMMENATAKGLVFTKSIQEICNGGTFIHHDGYYAQRVYRLWGRKDRVIDPIKFGGQGLGAIYENGEFSGITPSNLEGYSSQTLNKYLAYIRSQENRP